MDLKDHRAISTPFSYFSKDPGPRCSKDYGFEQVGIRSQKNADKYTIPWCSSKLLFNRAWRNLFILHLAAIASVFRYFNSNQLLVIPYGK